MEPEFEHLQWLCSKDQLVLSRAECADALRDENKLIHEMRQAIIQCSKASEYCRVASGYDADWSTGDVRRSLARKMRQLQGFIDELEANPPSLPEESAPVDKVKSRIFAGYAHSAKVTDQLASRIKDNPNVQKTLDAISTRLRRGGSNDSNQPSGVDVATSGSAPNQRAADGAHAVESTEAAEGGPLPDPARQSWVAAAASMASAQGKTWLEEVRKASSQQAAPAAEEAPSRAAKTFDRAPSVDGTFDPKNPASAFVPTGVPQGIDPKNPPAPSTASSAGASTVLTEQTEETSIGVPVTDSQTPPQPTAEPCDPKNPPAATPIDEKNLPQAEVASGDAISSRALSMEERW